MDVVGGNKISELGNQFVTRRILVLRFFWMWTIFKVFIEFVAVLFPGSDQGSNPQPLHRKVKS